MAVSLVQLLGFSPVPASQILEVDHVPIRVHMFQSLLKQVKLFTQRLHGTLIHHLILHRLLHQLDHQHADQPSKGFIVEGIDGLRNPDDFGYY